MRIVKDTSPRYKVQGITTLKGVGFPNEEEALKYAYIHTIMEILWHAWKAGKIDYKVPNPSFAVAQVLVEEAQKKRKGSKVSKILIPMKPELK